MDMRMRWVKFKSQYEILDGERIAIRGNLLPRVLLAGRRTVPEAMIFCCTDRHGLASIVTYTLSMAPGASTGVEHSRASGKIS
jgi:hypothetical protein